MNVSISFWKYSGENLGLPEMICWYEEAQITSEFGKPSLNLETLSLCRSRFLHLRQIA
jgi:hypothetical protein